jgi:hypothetical protein
MSYHKINIVLSFNDIEELEEFTKDYRCIPQASQEAI